MKLNNYFIFLPIILVTACSQNESKKSTETAPSDTQTSQQTQNPADKAYIVAVDSNFSPFTSLDEKGLPIGYDIDLIEAITKKSGIQIQIISKPWAQFPQALETNQVDMWIAGISITDERKQIVDFSDPYLSYTTSILTRSDPESLQMNQDNIGLYKLIALKGTVDYTSAQALVKNPENLVAVKTTFLGIKDIASKKADGFINNDKVLNYYMKQHPELKLRTFNITNSAQTNELGIAFKKGNSELIQKINTGLTQIKQDGTYNKINEKWFGKTE